MKRILFVFVIVLLSLMPTASQARENVNYWYIKNFDTEIIVNNDSSIDITENIVADCGNARKHGIFRILPTVQYLENETINSPITLKSITDFQGNKYHYQTTKDYFDNTVTWKIGSEDIYVTGINNYRIKYHVRNAVRHFEDHDELYWNLSGNFWDIPIDNFTGTVKFPDEINKDNLELNTYSGTFGEKSSLDTKTAFENSNTAKVSYSNTLEPGQGITLSASFPKGIVAPYVPTFWEKYAWYFSYLILAFVVIVTYLVWKRYGKDPKVNPTVAPEFEIPEKTAPIEMGLILSDGALRNRYISAGIIYLASKGYLKIKKIEKKGIFSSEDFEFEKSSQKSPKSPAEQALLSGLFSGREKVKLSSLKDKFYKNLPIITSAGKKDLYQKKYLVPSSRILFFTFLVLGLISIGVSIFAFIVNINLGISVLLSSITLIVASPFMRKRTKEGHEILRRIKGFKLYMDKAEKYRQQYFEKESIEKKTSIFEKLLPYAIMFGITKQWIKKMKNIYGEEYFNTYHPVWFYGAGIASFDADSFSNQISQMSSNMSSTMASSPSSSGSGGGGFSGGGGGGGGGGGW